jgi:hypothetical protein
MRVTSVSTTGGVQVSEWLPLDAYTEATNDGLFCKVTGTVAFGLEVTPDDVFTPAAKAAATAYPLGAPFAAGVVANVSGVLPYAVKAIRINQASGAGTVQLKVVNRGGI